MKLLSIILLSFALLSCTENITDSSDINTDYTLSKKPDGVEKPPQNKADPIVTLKINDVEIFNENNVEDYDGLLKLKLNDNNVIFNVYADEGDKIIYASVDLYYDADIDYLSRQNVEISGHYLEERDISVENIEHENNNWDLRLKPTANNDPTYRDFRLTDQLATRIDLVPDGLTNEDHFQFRVHVLTESGQSIVLRNWKWISNALEPLKTFYVDEIKFIRISPNKRDLRIDWKVKILGEEGKPIQNAEAYYWANIYPEGIGLGRAGVEPPDDEGWQYFSSLVNKREFPFTCWITAVQWYQPPTESGEPEVVLDESGNPIPISVYDPYSDDQPTVEPSFTLESATAQPVYNF